MNPLAKYNEKLKESRVKINEEENKAKQAIKALIDTEWSSDNAAQMKAVQLLKGIALSDDSEANEFMKKLDKFTSGLAK
jgi:hypothetical protein